MHPTKVFQHYFELEQKLKNTEYDIIFDLEDGVYDNPYHFYQMFLYTGRLGKIDITMFGSNHSWERERLEQSAMSDIRYLVTYIPNYLYEVLNGDIDDDDASEFELSLEFNDPIINTIIQQLEELVNAN